jgi:hypothetical protein
MASISISSPPQLAAKHLGQSDPPVGGNIAGSVSVSNLPFVFPPSEPCDLTAAIPESEGYIPPDLPSFSFKPGGLPASTPTSHLRPSGHRRELVGTDGSTTASVSGIVSGSGENLQPTPSSLPAPGPGFGSNGPGRRGHAHRRSAAISSVDLSAISKAFPTNPAGGSAPCTPADFNHSHSFGEEMVTPVSRSVTSLNRATPPDSPAKLVAPEDSCPGGKVGFNDNATVIPRPVSIISTETSSSLSTVRPNTSNVTSTVFKNMSAGPQPHTRPRTADPVVSLAKDVLSGFAEGSNLKRPVSVPDSLQSRGELSEGHDSKRKKHFWDEHRWKDSFKRTSMEEESPKMSHDVSRKVFGPSPISNSQLSAENRSQKLHTSRKKQKMRSWADAIFPLKGKRRYSKKSVVSRRTPTPPLKRANSDLVSLCDVDFDDDNTVIIHTPNNLNPPKPAFPELQTSIDSVFENSWKPKSFYEQRLENEAFSPVIDLDAALGPFNTPDLSCNLVAGSAFSIATRRMYSGGRRGEFIGPEMRYHRRAESAPEMPPFDRSALGNIRLSGNPAIANADVFYEEEEDAFLAGNNTSISSTDSLSIIGHSQRGPSSVDSTMGIKGGRVLADEGLRIQTRVMDSPCNPRSSSKADTKPWGITPEHLLQKQAFPVAEVLCQPKKSIEIVESDDWSSQVLNAPSSNVSPHFTPIDMRPCSSPVDFAYTGPHLPLSIDVPSSPAFPSPDLSNISFDAPRSAAASSMTDQTTFNSTYHDPIHGSSEDVPSLTSSASTMTNSKPRHSDTFYDQSSGERSASFSNQILRRNGNSNTTKRSSLVSLSRFVGVSHGEKSKLSYEEKPPGEEAENSKKKGNRFSRLMHFWKTKEKSKTKGDAN